MVSMEKYAVYDIYDLLMHFVVLLFVVWIGPTWDGFVDTYNLDSTGMGWRPFQGYNRAFQHNEIFLPGDTV
jgi:hypothetical protein